MALLPNFDALRVLHNSANDLLHSPEIQQALVDQRQVKFVHQVSEASLRMLDVCGNSRDVLLLVKDRLLDLQLTLRRLSIGEPRNNIVGTKLAEYNCCRKKLKKETVKCLRSLKRMKCNSVVSNSNFSAVDDNLIVVLDVLKEVRETTITIVVSLLSLISIPWLDQKKGSFIRCKFTRPGGQCWHDICDETALHSAHKRLEAVEIAIEDLEVELECMFRRLVQTRVSLLNLLTH